MKKKKLKKLNIDLAKNIVRFEHHLNIERQSVCQITIGGIIAVQTHALRGMEEEVLEEMVVKYWSIDDSIGLN